MHSDSIVENYNILTEKIENYYKNNVKLLNNKKFHLFSRLYLWSGDAFFKEMIFELKKDFIGENEKEYREKILSIVKENSEFPGELSSLSIRKRYFKKYPRLKLANKLLFKNLFCSTIYGLDVSALIKDNFAIEEFISIVNALKEDKESIAFLSTHAINNFYALDYMLGSDSRLIDLSLFYEVYKDCKNGAFKVSVNSRIYLLTHCIIGESAFYSRPLKREVNFYIKILRELKEDINKNYADVLMDVKLEFLVCSRICGVNFEDLENKIKKEAMSSISEEGFFIIEKGKSNSNSFRLSEHRNVLAMMVNKKCRFL